MTSVSEILKSIVKDLPGSLQTKLKNINKASADEAIPCTTKRISQTSREFIPYKIVKNNNITLHQLQTKINGVVVGLTYDVYESLRDNANKNELDLYLFENIGSDNIVSSIVYIMKEGGDSGSGPQREMLKKLKLEIAKNNWQPITMNGTFEHGKKHIGNKNWQGHYYYNICGGAQERFESWTDKEPQIFTTYKNHMNDNRVVDDVKACLIYQLLHVSDITNYIKKKAEVDNFKTLLGNYLKTKIYMGQNCIELINNLNVISKGGYLVSPILCKNLSIEDFVIKKAINISHNEAVCKNKIYWCENNKILLSDYRPGNLFWDLKIGNMQQQDFTIEEYWEDHHRRTRLREILFC